MKKTILITGISGFVGSHLAKDAVQAGYTVRGLVRPTSNTSVFSLPEDRIIRGDLTDPDSLKPAVEGVDAVVHCAATTSEMRSSLEESTRVNVKGTEHLLTLCKTHGVDDFVYISSQSAKPGNPSVYGRTKLEGEERTKHSGLNYRILRPNVIYGAGSTGLFAKMTRLIQKLPVIPVIGSGTEQLRPIYVQDLAQAILQCLEAPKTATRSYDLGGADVVTFNEFIAHQIETLQLSRTVMHIPIGLCLFMARGMQMVLANPPVTVDNIHGLKLLDPSTNEPAERDFGFQPRTLADGLSVSYAN